MIKAAGIMCLTADQKVLLLKRGAGGDHPGEWCFPGGRIEDGETALEAAIRETEEEAGRKVSQKALTLHTRGITNAEIAVATDELPAPPPGDAIVVPEESVDFSTYLCKIEVPFVPILNDEHNGWAWADVANPPEPLHPGCRVALARLDMNELDVARAMSRGELTSPQVYCNVVLWNIRITGTGVAYRESIKEYVYRKPEFYMTQEFLDRCNGLAAIWYHPAGATLNSEEYGRRTVGAVMLPYMKPEAGEVWGITKVYDDEINRQMLAEPASTSPTVYFDDPSEHQRLRTEEGEPILIECEPTLIDHIALLPKGALGVWDKKRGPNGVDRSGVFADAERPHRSIVPAYLTKLQQAEIGLATLNLRLSNLASAY